MGTRNRSSTEPHPAAAAASIAALYDAHATEVYRYVYRRCNDRSLAEDITQETFMAAVDATSDVDSISVGWLFTVARNRLIDVLRKSSRRERKLRLVVARNDDGHEDELAERLRVDAALSEMSVEYRLVLTLHYIEGLSVPALAQELGRSVKSIEALVTRARRELRTKLADGNGSVGNGGTNA